MITEFYKISKDGTLRSPDWHGSNEGDEFIVVPIVGAQWNYNGMTIRKIYPYNNGLELLRSRDAVIATEKSNESSGRRDELVVYEADGSERFRIKAPVRAMEQKSMKPFFYYVKYVPNSDKWLCYSNDGFGDIVADLDLDTGQLSSIRNTRV